MFEQCKNDSKKLWKNLNHICSYNNKKRKTSNQINKLIHDNKTITDSKGIAETFNHYFCNVASNINKSIDATNISHMSWMKNSNQKSIFLEAVTYMELSDLIDNLNLHKSSGPDNISPKIIHDVKYVIIEPLLFIYNLSLQSGIVPTQLKIAKVLPIFKKGDRSLPCNYRPISMLSVFDKLLEKIMYKRLMTFITKHSILNKQQFGFRTGHSTTLSLIEVMDELYKNLDDGNIGIGIFLDLQKAFDTIQHSILLDKIYHYGIRGLAHTWIKNYLSNRQQFVSTNGLNSSKQTIKFGVPQGSVLGPLLFLLYINDITNIDPSLKIKLFADDTNLFLYNKDIKILFDQSQKALQSINTWFTSNKLSVNTDKTNYCIFKNKNVNLDILLPDLTINNKSINKVKLCKYLGITLDDQLTFTNHINSIVTKLRNLCGMYYKLRFLLPQKSLKNLYFALVQPHLTYGLEIYGNTAESNLDPLSKTNNKILRILQNKPMRTHVDTLYRNYNTMNLLSLRNFKLACLIHKFAHHPQELPEVFNQYFTYNRDIHSHNTRTNASFHVMQCKTSVGQRSLKVLGCGIWNKLPKSICAIQSEAIFKRRIKQILAISR